MGDEVDMRMNKPASVLMVVLAATMALSACEKKTIGTKIDDALDNRPAEKLQDKVEEVQDKVKDATN